MSDVERATKAIDVWLRQEVVDSTLGQNKILDDYGRTRQELAGLPGFEAAYDNAKNSSHHDRYKQYIDIADEDALRNEDRLVARLIHHALMFTSGGFRVESFLRSGSQDDYEVLRWDKHDRENGATSLPIGPTIAPVLGRWIGEKVNIDAYRDLSYQLNDGIRRNSMSIYEWFQDNPGRAFDALRGTDEPVEAAVENQRAGLVLAATNIAVATTLRDGDMRRVPFLKAATISHADPDNPVYPMAS